MTSNAERVSATIYQFPHRRVRPRSDAPKATKDMTRYADLAFDSCWYHEEALREVDGDRSSD